MKIFEIPYCKNAAKMINSYTYTCGGCNVYTPGGSKIVGGRRRQSKEKKVRK